MWRSVVVLLLICRVQASQNLAKGKIVSANAVLASKLDWNAKKAVDGNKTQNVWCGSCLHTQVTKDVDAFLNINLGGSSTIKRVEIYARRRYTKQCSSDSVLNTSDNGSNYRFKGYRIDIDDVTCYQDRSQPFPEPYQNNSCVGTGVNVKVIQVHKPEPEPDLPGPLLELCEVEIYGCQVGRYGPDCKYSCNVNCLNEICDPDNGDCLNGCVNGYRGHQCNLECNAGWFGANCSHRCGNCFNQSCHHIDGDCLQRCNRGYMGLKCNQECDQGFYGQNCSQECGQCKDMDQCHHVNGTCSTGCKDGYNGRMCIEKCDGGWFGANCSHRCGNCFNQSCNHSNGVCPQGCDRGYMESTCNQNCTEGWFGYNCSRRCGYCLAGTYCDGMTGDCPSGCESGYQAPMCLDECPAYKYGENCGKSCGNCKNNSICHHVTGICSNGCDDGWIEDQCLTPCAPGKFGTNCEKTCMGNCYQNASCFHKDGRCKEGCEAGYQGSQCKEECYNGTYGMNCVKSCGNCKTGSCHYKDGTCMEGCFEGWDPPYCTQRVRASPPPESDSSGMIGGIIATLVVMAAVILVIILWRRRQGQQHDKIEGEEPLSVDYNTSGKAVNLMSNLVTEENGGAKNTASDLSREMVDDDEDEANEEVMYSNTSAVVSKLHKTEMIVSDLGMIIQEKKQEEMFALEFSKLAKGAVHPHDIGKMPENKPKNRFLTTFPYDHSLVKLSTSVYINANFISSVEKPEMYIATQGPKSNTVADFWQMAWEKNSGKIVMLANIIELGKRKCERYWPSDTRKHMDIKPYRLTLKEEKCYGAFTTRLIQIQNTQSNEHRNIHHFHFTTWPDHGTPDSWQLVFFHHIIDRTETKHTGPVIVHCSAGIGRTGTYIALDALQCWMKAHTTIDVHKFTENMRKDRMNMIQTLDQYIGLHEALMETKLLMNTDISTIDFSEMWIRQSRPDIPKNELRVQTEFQKLHTHRPTLNNNDKRHALDTDNISKNRSTDVLPMLKYRPYLLSHPTSRSNYINAVIVPTLTHQNGFIMTQYPLADTVQDFWCLVYDQESSLVVFLEPNEEGIALYPGKGKTALFGKLYITETECEVSKGMNERRIDIQKKDTEEIKQIHVIEITAWLWRHTLPGSATSLLNLVLKVQEFNSSHPIITVCFDGSTKCGVFCALHNVIENILQFKEVTTMRSVRQIQLRRPEVIGNVEQYEFLYKAVYEHLEQSSMYQNT